jgi:hypothetical protein
MSEQGQLTKKIQQTFDLIERDFSGKYEFTVSNGTKINIDLIQGFIGWISFGNGERVGLVSGISMGIIKKWDNDIKQEFIFHLEELILTNV